MRMLHNGVPVKGTNMFDFDAVNDAVRKRFIVFIEIWSIILGAKESFNISRYLHLSCQLFLSTSEFGVAVEVEMLR